MLCSFFFQAEDGIRYGRVTGVQTCALPISCSPATCSHAECGPAGPGGADRRHPQRRRHGRLGGHGTAAGRHRAAPVRRSEERRVGKEGRSWGGPEHLKKKKGTETGAEPMGG